MNVMMDALDKERVELNPLLVNKTEYSQYLTPVSVARFMATFFDEDTFDTPKILDAGAGIGTLTSALLERLVRDKNSDEVECTFVEIDSILGSRIENTIQPYRERVSLESHIIPEDFIEWGVELVDTQLNIFNRGEKAYTHAIMNPPYKKINSNSTHRKLLSGVGIEVVNLYSAFVGLAIKLLQSGGQLVAIIPRSFCNGVYYKPFRELILQEAAIKHFHLFESRNKAFRDDEVLQENVIMMLERGASQGDVKISTSTDDSFMDYSEDFVPFSKVLQAGDNQKFFRIPTNREKSIVDLYDSVRYTLKDLGVSVSTGPVVGFRKKEHLRMMPEEGTVPLLYPTHIEPQGICWVKENSKKPNAIVRNEETEKLLYSSGYYTIIRRRSSKEERKRIISGVVIPERFNSLAIGFENGLNVLHKDKGGIGRELAFGLHVYLSSTLVDKYFRLFNGHTQVNATDLRAMLFPSTGKLEVLGEWFMQSEIEITQEIIDEKLGEVLQCQEFKQK